ncbi:hypothetical protein M1523_00410 [Patescibacteria group bacterium]|nr:hypothetical protein [Patescibacteria group bacterium]MCL5091901.1 hypothetical protein [Patescibacteria group bacterium]
MSPPHFVADHSNQPFFLREQIIKTARSFFDRRGFHEVMIPMLNPAIPNEPNIHPFTTTWKTRRGERRFFLPISPERHMKQTIAQGIIPCFSISPVMRNLEDAGSVHAPEFLMLEWYRIDTGYRRIIKDVRSLVNQLKQTLDRYLNLPTTTILRYQSQTVDLKSDWPIVSLEELFATVTGLNYQQVITDDRVLFDQAAKKGYAVNGSGWGELFDQIFVNEIVPALPNQPCFVTDFPARLSPLCRVNRNKPYLAERFEFYLFRVEVGNGNNENTDADQVAKVIDQDPEFIETLRRLDRSGHRYAGVGLGLDRLIMVLTDQTQI